MTGAFLPVRRGPAPGWRRGGSAGRGRTTAPMRAAGGGGTVWSDAPAAFGSTPLDGAAARVAAVLAEERPEVVMTYNENGFYGHPDHIQAHRVTVAAIERSGIPDKLYYPAVPESWLGRFAELLASRGVEVPDAIADAPFGTPDTQIGAVVDVAASARAKYASLAAHASQAENIFFLSLGEDLFAEVFREEAFVRAQDRTGAAGREDDLFSGLR